MKRTQSESRHSNRLRLSSGDAHHCISEQLLHLLSNVTDGYSCDQQTVSDMVVKASVTGAAIDRTCNAFADAPTGMTVRSRLNNEPSVTELQKIRLCWLLASSASFLGILDRGFQILLGLSMFPRG